MEGPPTRGPSPAVAAEAEAALVVRVARAEQEVRVAHVARAEQEVRVAQVARAVRAARVARVARAVQEAREAREAEDLSSPIFLNCSARSTTPWSVNRQRQSPCSSRIG